MSDFNEAQTENLGKGKTNNLPEDPTGTYPTPDYMFISNANKEAKGESRTDLKPAVSDASVKEAKTDTFVNSIYGLNQVQRSITGHSFEIDDTPGNERVLIYHNTGAGIELRPDGGVTVNSTSNRIDITGGDQVAVVEGDANVVYNGNVTMQVKGEFNIDCLDFNITTRGNKTEKIYGAENKTVSKGSTNRIIGNLTNYITERQTDVILGNHSHSVKGDYENNIGNNIALYSGGNINITAKTYLNASTDNMTMSANNMTVQGGAGTIGGTGMLFSGKGARFEEGVTAPTFTGDLDGLAKQAITSDVTNSQNYADPDPGGGTGTAAGWTLNNIDTPLIVKPTATNVNDYLTTMQGGIRNVAIDDGNFIKNTLDKTVRYSGVSNADLDLELARSKLRNTKNRKNSRFVQSLLEEDIIDKSYNDAIPPAIGRVLDGESSTLIANNTSSPMHPDQAVVHIPRYTIGSFPPEPRFNPWVQDNITIKTQLGVGYSLAKFLGSNDPTNIKHIKDLNKRKEIAAALYLQTIPLAKIKNNKTEFAGITLVVTEGLYRPGPDEEVEKGSIADLKMQGRAVVYKALDPYGRETNERLFDIAAHLKDTAYFDELILSYDSLKTDIARRSDITARLILVMPKLGSDYTGTFKREVRTEFNGNKLSQGELVEVKLPEKLEPIKEVTYSSNDSGPLLIWAIPKKNRKVNPILVQKLERIAKKFGKPLTITSGYRDPKNPSTKSKGAGYRSQHVLGNAVDIRARNYNLATRARLIRIACEEGITGVGIYTNKGAKYYGRSRGGESIHFDIRPAKTCWGDNLSSNSLWYYPWAYQVLAEKGFYVGSKKP